MGGRYHGLSDLDEVALPQAKLAFGRAARRVLMALGIARRRSVMFGVAAAHGIISQAKTAAFVQVETGARATAIHKTPTVIRAMVRAVLVKS